MRKLSTDLIKSGSFTGSFSGSFYGLSPSSSYALTASFSNNSISASYSLNSTTATNLSGGTVNAISITGSLLGSSSFANNAISSSFSSVSISSSFALTASNLSPIAQDLIPITGSTYSLGSPTNKWKDLYVSTGSIYIGETVLSTSGSTLFANSSPIVTLNTASGQIEVVGITASLSSSFASNANLLNNTASTVFATTGSNTFSGSQTVQGNITVIGSLIAQQYVISSSVSYFTSSNFDGSTKFGDTDSDTHQFTGSLRSPNITGSLLGTASIALVALTSSYINVATNAISSSFADTASVSVSSSYSSYAITSSYNLNSVSSSYSLNSVSSSYSLNSVSSSYSLNSVSSSYSNVANTATSATSANTATSASFATTAGTATSATSATSANTATSASFATTAGTATSATSATSANSATSASYALTASFALNSSGGGGSGTVSGSTNYISKFTSGSAIGNSVIYETGSNIGIGTINPNAKLNINSSGSLVSGSVVFSVEGTQGSLFSVDDSLSGSLMSVNDISGLPILEVFSDDRLVVGTYNSNALVVTGSRVGIGISNPIAKLQVSGNISGSSFTSSVSNGVGFLGTSSFSVTASYALNALTASFALNASGGGGGSGTVTGSLNYISKFTSTTTVGNSVMYETGSNIGIGTINPNAKLNINSSGSLVSGSVVFSVEGTQGSLFSVDDSLSGSLMSVNDISGLPILEVFSDDRLVVGTYNSNALVVTGSRVGIGTNNPIAKLQVNGNISASSFTGSVFGTSSWSTNALTASYAAGGGTTLTTGSTYPITSSWATTSSNIIGGTSNYIPLWSTNTSLGNSVLYQNSSNIGIGTTSPASILHLQSSAATTLLRIDNSTNTNDAAILLTDSTNPTGEGLRITYDSSIGDTYFNNIYTVSTRAFNFQKGDFGSGTSLLTILNDGNVGIGTTSPGYKLDVVGAVRSTIDNSFSFASNRSAITVWSGLGFLTNNVNKWFVGLRETSDDNLRWYNFTNSSERMVLTETGNLGIGTTSPNAKLHLSSTGGISAPILRISGTATDTYNWASAALYSNLTSSATAVHVIGKSETNYNSAYFGYKHSSDGSVNNAISFGFYAANDLVNILVNGNFGIGTTSPAYKLDVNGSASFADNVIITKNQNALTRLIVSNTTSNSSSYVETAFVNDVASGAGAVGRYGSTTTTYKIVTANNQYLYNGPTAGDIAILNDFASGSIKMSAGGNSNVQFIISSSGNVGIGTTNPSAKLHVNGNISGSSFTGSVFGTSSWATNASTASYVVNSVSSSYALTASYALNAASSGGSSSTSSLTGQTFVPTASVSQLSLTQSVSNNDQILVILDGLVQSRTGSYTVSGSTLTLTENAESGSIIDIRFLAGSSVSSSYATTALSASYLITTTTGTTKAIFGYGNNGSGVVSITNLVSNTGVVATDTTGVGSARYALAAAGYSTDKAVFGYGYTSVAVSMTNLVSNTGVVATDTTGVGTTRIQLAAARYGGDKAIFGYGSDPSSIGLSMTNLVNNVGLVASDTTGVGTGRRLLAAAEYATDRAIFGYGYASGANLSMTNLVGNNGIVASDTTGVGTARYGPAAAGYGGDKAIFGYGNTGTVVSVTNLVSNTGVVATNTTGVGTARVDLAAAGYGNDKAIFGYGYNGSNFVSMTNLVSNTGVVATDTTGVGTARNSLAAAGYSAT